MYLLFIPSIIFRVYIRIQCLFYHWQEILACARKKKSIPFSPFIKNWEWQDKGYLLNFVGRRCNRI